MLFLLDIKVAQWLSCQSHTMTVMSKPHNDCHVKATQWLSCQSHTMTVMSKSLNDYHVKVTQWLSCRSHTMTVMSKLRFEKQSIIYHCTLMPCRFLWQCRKVRIIIVNMYNNMSMGIIIPYRVKGTIYTRQNDALCYMVSEPIGEGNISGCREK